MKKIAVLIIILISIQICHSGNNENKVKNVEVTYIANEGFLIKVGDKKILIDALFGDKDYGFCDIPTESTMNSILKSENHFPKHRNKFLSNHFQQQRRPTIIK